MALDKAAEKIAYWLIAVAILGWTALVVMITMRICGC